MALDQRQRFYESQLTAIADKFDECLAACGSALRERGKPLRDNVVGHAELADE